MFDLKKKKPQNDYGAAWTGESKDPSSRYDQMTNQLASILASRQQANEQAARATREAEVQDATHNVRDWNTSAAQGAMTGLSMSGGNPWGALAGGVIGGGLGLYRSMRGDPEHGVKGVGFGEALSSGFDELASGHTFDKVGGGVMPAAASIAQYRRENTPVAGQTPTGGTMGYSPQLMANAAGASPNDPTGGYSLTPEQRKRLFRSGGGGGGGFGGGTDNTGPSY